MLPVVSPVSSVRRESLGQRALEAPGRCLLPAPCARGSAPLRKLGRAGQAHANGCGHGARGAAGPAPSPADWGDDIAATSSEQKVESLAGVSLIAIRLNAVSVFGGPEHRGELDVPWNRHGCVQSAPSTMGNVLRSRGRATPGSCPIHCPPGTSANVPAQPRLGTSGSIPRAPAHLTRENRIRPPRINTY